MRKSVSFIRQAIAACARVVLLSSALASLPAQTLEYATFFGGDRGERANGVAFDREGNVYMVGQSRTVVAAPGSFYSVTGQTDNIFVLKVDPTLSQVLYLAVFGGTGTDRGAAIAVDAAGAAYVAGVTGSAGFPTTRGAYLETLPAGAQRAAFVTKLSPDGARLELSTLLSGGSRDEANALALDDQGKIWIAGYSTSAAFPVSPKAFQPERKGSDDAFVARFSADGAELEAATLLGGAICERPLAGVACDHARTIAIDGERVIVGGGTLAPDFPLAGETSQTTFGGGVAYGDGFIAALDRDLTTLQWSAYLGGRTEDIVNAVAVDVAGDILAVGSTASEDFPLTRNLLPPFVRDREDAFLARIDGISGELIFSGVFGGDNGDAAQALATDGRRGVVVVGETASPAFPATPGVIQPAIDRPRADGGDAFLAMFGFQPSPRFSAEGVVSAASLLRGPIAPGEMLSVFGRAIGPDRPATLTTDADGRVATALGGVRVLVNGVAAPLLFVSRGQINFVVPYAAGGFAAAQLVIDYEGGLSRPVMLPSRAASPALFTLSDDGSGQAAALNQDSTLNTAANPVRRGEVIVLYGTGAGRLEPSADDGAFSSPPYAKPAAAITVRIGGAEAQIDYAGAAPGLISGVIQINARVPTSIPVGGATSVSFTAGEARSPAGVTIAVN